MGGDPPVLNGSFPAGDSFEHAHPILQRFKGANIHQIGGGNSVLSDENGYLILCQLGENPGGSPLESCHKVGFHKSDTKVSPCHWQAQISKGVWNHGGELVLHLRQLMKRHATGVYAAHCRRTRNRRGAPRGHPQIPGLNPGRDGQARGLPLRRDRVAQGVGVRLAAPWFRIHYAERRVGQLVPAKSGALPLHLAIAFTPSNSA